MNLAVTGAYPLFTISYPDVLVAKGLLPGAKDATAAAQPDGTILFNWTDNSDTGTAKQSDTVVLLAYIPSLQQVVFSFGGATRVDCSATLDAALYKGHSAETWMSLLTADEQHAADSTYTGSIQL